jgi:hypothetical protein
VVQIHFPPPSEKTKLKNKTLQYSSVAGFCFMLINSYSNLFAGTGNAG